MRRAAFLTLMLVVISSSIAAADIYAPRISRVGPDPDMVVERRWWLETGPVFPDRQGTTGYWQTGFGLGGGVEFPMERALGLFIRAQSGLLPLRGSTSAGDTLSGESWTLYSLTLGLHHRLVAWPNSPSVRLITGIEAGAALQHFGRYDERGLYSNGTQAARRENGMLLGFGAGFEVAPEAAIGGFAEARFHWYSSDVVYTWSTIEAGITFPW
jgi:hypothetical protein